VALIAKAWNRRRPPQRGPGRAHPAFSETLRMSSSLAGPFSAP
jgi:hypothetical protein